MNVSPATAAPLPAPLPHTLAASGRTDSWTSALTLCVAAVGLGHALQLSNGTLHPEALAWVLAAVGLSLVPLLSLRVPWLERWGERPAFLVLGLGLAVLLGHHLTARPGMYLRAGADLVAYYKWFAAAMVLASTLLSRQPLFGRLTVPLLLAVHFILGLWMLDASPRPIIDVYDWTLEAFRYLARGENPYAGTMPNTYGHTMWYPPGLADAYRVHLGYPYPPLTLLMGGLGHLVKADFRYANLVSLTLAGALLAYARPGRLGTVVAVVLLFTPREFFILEQGWTDAYVVLLLAGTVFCMCRFPRLTPYVFGLLVVVKQYTFFVVLLSFLLVPGPFTWRGLLRFLLHAAIPAVLVTAPFALWNLPAFLDSVLIKASQHSFRADALSLMSYTARNGKPVLPLWLHFVMMVPAVALAAWRTARTPAGFSAAVAFLFLMFFVFSKHAFCNHYFLVLGALCCAAATLAPTPPVETEASPSPS
jgi:hypothetical protein